MSQIEGLKKELARIREQRNIAVEALLEIAIKNGVYLAVGYFTSNSAKEISKEEFLEDLRQMNEGKLLAPISAIDDEKYADITVFWLREVAEYGVQLRFQESNIRGFADDFAQIEKAINKRSNCKFIRHHFIPSFLEDLKAAILNAN